MTIPLDVLLRDSAYKLDQFKPAHGNALRCLLVHGDMEPSKENHEVVKQCYGLLHLMMRF